MIQRIYVAYPRSGSNFLHQALTLYCGFPSYNGGLYLQSHDMELTEKHRGCFYVWRDPLKVIFSYFSAEYCNEQRVVDLSLLTEEWLGVEVQRLKEHFEYYWENAGLVVRYRDLMENRVWSDILSFFGLDYDEERMLKCASEVTLDVTIKWNGTKWFTDFMKTDEYKAGRVRFEEMYADKILDEFSRYLNKDRAYLTQDD